MASDDYGKMTSDDYKKVFSLLEPSNSDVKKALEVALDTRKFEIDLYWKRAAYFWTFLAITLAGYFTVLTAKEISYNEKGEALVIISCLGVVFSVAWYFVNRASKFWQENWEKHVDMLENSVIGPLYKTVLCDADLHFIKLWGPYPFSVSKLNQILSLFVVVLFFVLAVSTLHRHYQISWPPDPLSTVVVLLSIAAVATFCWKGRTRMKNAYVCAAIRTTKIS